MLERGLERAVGPVTVAAYVEIEAFCIFNLVAQMEQGVVDPAPVWTDAKTFPARSFHRKIHGIIGGYPCQPFSLAGKRQGEADPRHLWPYLRSHIKSIRPVWCFFENVDDHLTLGFDTVYKELRAMGYRVEVGIYSAEEVGAPHERQRIFILALADTYCNGYSKRLADGQITGTQKRIEVKNRQRQRLWIEPTSGCETLADTSGSKLEIGVQQSTWEECPATERSCTKDIWPSGQGEYQHDWEHPRVIESGVGCTVDGYNFREDLLRMLGNGVVEQTAELAMLDLLNKHGIAL